MTSVTQRGFSLLELMVSMSIGIVLVGAAISVHVRGQDTYIVNERNGRLAEGRRYLADVLLSDLRASGYWAETEFPASINRRANDPANPMPPGFFPANDCYAGSWINVNLPVEVVDHTQVGAANILAGCVPEATRLPGTDMLLVRHADPQPAVALDAGRLYLISTPIGGELFIGGQPIPAGFDPLDPIHAVNTHVYYVSPRSSAGANVPSLRRMRLDVGPQFVDEEVMTGVDDFQVQLGRDTDADNDANVFVNEDSPLAAGGQPVAARVWLRIRTVDAEVGYENDTVFEYAGVNRPVADGFRRLVMNNTVQLRNGRANP